MPEVTRSEERGLAASALKDIDQVYLVRCRAEKRLDGKTAKAYRCDNAAAVRPGTADIFLCLRLPARDSFYSRSGSTSRGTP